jgi:hypothetical protein
MDLSERLAQAKADRAAIEENIKDLEKQIEEKKFPSSIWINQVWEYYGSLILINAIADKFICNDQCGYYFSSLTPTPLTDTELLSNLKKYGARYLGTRSEILTIERKK